jgi:thiol:disulfide interchange protein DsbD
VCDDQLCVPEGATLNLDLTAGDGATDPAQASRFAAARAAIPKPVDWPARFAFAGDRFVLGVPFAQAAKVRSGYFFPAVEGAIGYAAPQTVGIAGDQVRAQTSRPIATCSSTFATRWRPELRRTGLWRRSRPLPRPRATE